MKIELLYFEGCPGHTPTLVLLRELIDELGLDAEVEQIEVIDPGDVTRLRFLGSPTIRVDGEDIESERRDDERFSMSCRRYGFSGVPSRELVIAALSRSDRP